MSRPVIRLAPADFDVKVAMTGAACDDLVDVRAIADVVWGDCAGQDSGLIAFAYLYRRFGPPIHGCDPRKDLASYALTTSDPDVFLLVHPGSELRYSIGYRIPEDVKAPALAARQRWCDDPQRVRPRPKPDQAIVACIDDALRLAMFDLLRPVALRDTLLTILGCDCQGRRRGEQVEPWEEDER